MTTQYLTIEARHLQYLSGLADFTTSAGESVDPNIVITNPKISLYCLDDSTERAIFTELPNAPDLSTAPFIYQMQREQVERLIAMPYETFRQLAYTLPEVQHLIQIYITGRSGSTLLSHIFNALDDVLSLSEPDAPTQFVHLRPADGSRDAELRDLLDCTMRILFKPTPFKSPTTYAIKLRNEGLRLMDLFQTTFPHVRNLFLYRDAIGFVRSFYRIFKAWGLPDNPPVEEFMATFEQLMNFDFRPLSVYLDPGTERITIPAQLTLWWMSVIEVYLAQVATGIPVLAVRYADLTASREPVIGAIFDYCGLPKERAKETLGVFERDAQAGTGLARENPREGNQLQLTEEEQALVTRILARHPVIKESNFIVPGTLTL